MAIGSSSSSSSSLYHPISASTTRATTIPAVWIETDVSRMNTQDIIEQLECVMTQFVDARPDLYQEAAECIRDLTRHSVLPISPSSQSNAFDSSNK